MLLAISSAPENCGHVLLLCLISLGDSSPESDSDESEAVELMENVRWLLYISISPFITEFCSSKSVTDGKLLVEEPGEGGVTSLLVDSCDSEVVRVNIEDTLGLETDFRRLVL